MKYIFPGWETSNEQTKEEDIEEIKGLIKHHEKITLKLRTVVKRLLQELEGEEE